MTTVIQNNTNANAIASNAIVSPPMPPSSYAMPPIIASTAYPYYSDPTSGYAGFTADEPRKPLSSDELTELAKKMTTIFPPDETLVMVVDNYWSEFQIHDFLSKLDRERKGKVLIIREPKNMTLVKNDAPVMTREDRINLLTRIGVIWEDNPGLTLSAIIGTMLGAHRIDNDEAVMTALELAWG